MISFTSNKRSIFITGLILGILGIVLVLGKLLGWPRGNGVSAFLPSLAGTQVSPSPTPLPPQYFVVVGDTGAATPAQFAVAKAMQASCEQVGGCQAGFIAGDAIYENSVSSVTDPQFQTKFEEPYKNLSIPLYIAYGNHDYLGCAECYLEYANHSQKWRMPASYYVQSFGDEVSFFVIDTEKFGTVQQQWLKDNLTSNQAHHKVVIGHRPIETFETTKLGENWNGKAELQEILCQTGDLYVAGHAHVLEDNGQIGDCSVKQLVAGGGGAHLRTVSEKSDGDFSAAKHGFVLLKVSEQELNYSFIDSQGEVLFKSQAVPSQK